MQGKPLTKTSYSLPICVSNALDNHPVAALSIHHFTIAALDAFIAAGNQPITMGELNKRLDTIVERDAPKTFAPPKSLGKPIDHYKAVAKSLGVSLSALIANATAAALQMHPDFQSA